MANCVLAAALAVTAGCSAGQPATSAEDSLVVGLLYPTSTSSAEMGQTLKSIIRVLDRQGNVVGGAQVAISVFDPTGQLMGNLPATFGDGDVYRTDAWTIPHRMKAGTWTLRAEATAKSGWGSAAAAFRVNDSVSEKLLNKYGFWIAAPALRGIRPDLVKEQGDARNGLIIWGGVLPAQHIFPESWLVIHWREGDFRLSTAEQVRAFMLGSLGDLGFSPVRDLGPFKQTRFKGWEAWQGTARGQFTRYDEQWMIFYAAEVNKTYAIGTTTVQAPTGIDAHAMLRDSFEVHPEVAANGVAPAPLPMLLPAPELVSPELGSRVIGIDSPIELSWKPLKDLAADEYYRVRVDYNYEETNPMVEYNTRDTRLTLPETLYHLPNCGVFNWTVALMQRTQVGAGGEAEGKPLSYESLYWYVEWLHPAGAAPFKLLCPNPQT